MIWIIVAFIFGGGFAWLIYEFKNAPEMVDPWEKERVDRILKSIEEGKRK